MTREQQTLVLDSLSKVSPDICDRSDAEKMRANEQWSYEIMNRAMGLFERRDWGDFVEPMQMPKDREVALVQKYQDLLKFGTRKRMELTKEMPVAERVNIWKTQLAYHLATGRFSKVRNEFIVETLMYFSPEFFDRSNLKKEGESEAGVKLLAGILAVFPKEEGYAIFMAVGIHKDVKDEPTDPTNLEQKKCQCLVFCSSWSEVCGEEHGCVSNINCGPGGTLGCHFMCEPI